MKQCFKNIVFYGFTVALIIGMGAWAGHLLRPADMDGCRINIDTFQTLPSQSIDVIVYGSSHAWRGFDTQAFSEEYGYTSYNFGANGQHINTTYLMLQESLKTQTPKYVFIETYFVNELLKNTGFNYEIYYTKSLPESPEKMAYLRQCFGEYKEQYISYYIPLCIFHERWTELEKDNFVVRNYQEIFQSSNGFFPMSEKVSVEIGDYKTFKQNKLSVDAKETLDKMMALCKEKDIRVIFFTVPYGEVEYNYHDAMTEYAEKNDCMYIDLFEKYEEVGLDKDNDFSDNYHLNKHGGKKVALYLGSLIE